MKYLGWRNWLSVAALVSVLSACSGTPEPDYAELQTFDEQVTPSVAWRARIGSGTDDYFSRLQPAYDDGVLYAADRQGQIAAFNADNGNRLWRTSIAPDKPFSLFSVFRKGPPARISGGLVVAGDALYLGTENGDIYALEKASGKVIWHRKVPGEVLAKPAVGEGFVVAHLGDGSVIGLDARDGSERWKHEEDVPTLSLRGTSSPVIASGGVLVGTNSGRAMVLILESGQLAWDERVVTPTGSSDLERMVDIDATPVLRGDTAYMLAYNGELVALELRTGETLWKRDYSGYRTPQVTSTRLFITDSDSHVIGLDRLNGNERWRNNQLYNRSLTEPVVLPQHVVAGDRFGYLHWFDRDDGQIVGRMELSDSVQVAPVRAGDYLIVQTVRGRILAIQQ